MRGIQPRPLSIMNLLNSEPNMLITYRTTISGFLQMFIGSRAGEEQEIDCLKKADELGYNLFTPKSQANTEG